MIDALIHRIKLRQAQIQESLAKGIPASWDAYQRMVGEHNGLQEAMNMIDAMLDEEKNRD
jgi:hypothetical protein